MGENTAPLRAVRILIPSSVNMLLPLHDDNPLRRIRFGWWTAGFIAACVLVFLYQMTLPEREAMRFVFAYGAIPSVVAALRVPIVAALRDG